MGKYDESLYRYLEDNERFADLFNGIHFGGEQIIKAQDLENDSEKYVEQETEGHAKHPLTTGRTRDIKKRFKKGIVLRILATEMQGFVDYTMPWRCMNYDVLEYEKQIRSIQSANKQKNIYGTPAERLCRFHKDDHIIPVYTLCLYHGMEPWDGPKCLKDMMHFEETDSALWKTLFSDYPLHLVCVNDLPESSVFHTSLKLLFDILPLRDDPDKLRSHIISRPEFQNLDRDTIEVISVMTNSDFIWDNLDEYENEEGGYNMCPALEGIKEEGKLEGLIDGQRESILALLSELETVSDALHAKIYAQSDSAILTKWLKLAAKASSLAEFESKL